MTPFTVHTIPGSPFARAVLAALEEKRAKYQVRPLAPRTPEHLARHPFGRMPFIEHDGFWLYETQAILRYIDRTVPQPALTPANPRSAARMDQVMNVNDWYLFQGVGNVIAFERLIKPMLFKQDADEARVVAALPDAQRVFAELAQLLGDQPFFAGDALSLADLIVAPQVDFLAETPEWAIFGAPHRNVAAWLERMRARPSLQATTMERVAQRARAA